MRFVSKRKVPVKYTVGGILLAGGSDQKIRGGADSAFLSAGSLPALVRAMQALEFCPEVQSFVVVADLERTGIVRAMAARYACSKLRAVAPAQVSRLACVASGLRALPDNADLVVIHEASRPFVGPSGISAVVQVAAKGKGGATTGFRVTSGIRTGSSSKPTVQVRMVGGLWMVASPQACVRQVLQKAIVKAKKTKAKIVDETNLMDLMGLEVFVVECEDTNLRLQCADDLVVAAHLLG